MSDETPGVNVVFGANIKGLLDGMKEAANAVNSGTQAMGGAFNNLTGIFGKVTQAFGILGGVLAGGFAFKEAVSATKNWNGEAIRLAATLGITTEEASALNVALGDIYSSSDEYLNAARMMTRQISAGGEGFKALGIEQKKANGEQKTTNELMMESINKISGMKQGLQQQEAGMKIFGRGWGEASKLMKLNNEVMAEAKKKAEEFNLIVGGDSIEAQKKYKAAMNDVDDAMLGIKLAIGREVMPVLADFAKELASNAKPAIEAVAWSVKTLITGFYTLKFIIATVATSIGAYLGAIIDSVGNVSRAIAAFSTGNYKEAVFQAKQAAEAIKANFKGAAQVIGEDYKALGEKLVKIWDKPANTGATRVGKSGSGEMPEQKGDTSAKVKGWEAELKKQQEILSEEAYKNGQFYERDLAAEVKFWNEKKGLTEAGSKERAAVESKIAETLMASHRQDLETRRAQLQAEAEAVRNNLQEKLVLARKEQAMFQEGSKGFEEAKRKVLAIEREISEQMDRLRLQQASNSRDAVIAQAELESENLRHRLAMGDITAQQELEAQRALLAKKLQAEQDYLAAEMQQANLSVEETAKLNQKKVELQEKYTQDVARVNNKMVEEQAEATKRMLEPVNQAFETSFQGLLNFTMKWSDAVRNVWRSLGQVLDKFIIDMAKAYITGKNREVAAEYWATAQKIAIQTWGAIKSVALAVWTGLKWIAVKGWEAAAGAFSAIASIPYVGPFLAPVVAAGALAAVIGMGSKLASAAGGWDLPKGINPVTQLHSGEMVLPQALADKVRNMTDEPKQNVMQAQFNITALDARSVERVIRDNNSSVGRALRDYARNFGGR